MQTTRVKREDVLNFRIPLAASTPQSAATYRSRAFNWLPICSSAQGFPFSADLLPFCACMGGCYLEGECRIPHRFQIFYREAISDYGSRHFSNEHW